MKRILLTFLLCLCAISGRSATVYGNLEIAQGVPWINTSIKFTPKSTPMSITPFFIGSAVVSTNTDTNGFFSINLVHSHTQRNNWRIRLVGSY